MKFQTMAFMALLLLAATATPAEAGMGKSNKSSKKGKKGKGTTAPTAPTTPPPTQSPTTSAPTTSPTTSSPTVSPTTSSPTTSPTTSSPTVTAAPTQACSFLRVTLDLSETSVTCGVTSAPTASGSTGKGQKAKKASKSSSNAGRAFEEELARQLEADFSASSLDFLDALASIEVSAPLESDPATGTPRTGAVVLEFDPESVDVATYEAFVATLPGSSVSMSYDGCTSTVGVTSETTFIAAPTAAGTTKKGKCKKGGSLGKNFGQLRSGASTSSSNPAVSALVGVAVVGLAVGAAVVGRRMQRRGGYTSVDAASEPLAMIARPLGYGAADGERIAMVTTPPPSYGGMNGNSFETLLHV